MGKSKEYDHYDRIVTDQEAKNHAIESSLETLQEVWRAAGVPEEDISRLTEIYRAPKPREVLKSMLQVADDLTRSQIKARSHDQLFDLDIPQF
ncbi:hypothetical protein HY404_01600 [Candidatus Microgenomates bacterium]|nr:hypothetical protein [Candidatus Microgenomates bacterium]